MSQPELDSFLLLSEALAAIIKPIVKQAVREAISVNNDAKQITLTDKAFLTESQASELSGLGVSTIRLYIRKRQLRAQKVGRRILIKGADLESFLESNPIATIP